MSRLAPFWPPYREWAMEQSRASPAASEREVVRRIVNNGRTVGLAGYSPLIGWTRNGWWETVNDIAHDIKRKYRYYVVTDVGQVELTLAEGRVTAVTGDENVLDRLPTDQRDQNASRLSETHCWTCTSKTGGNRRHASSTPKAQT